MVLRQRFLIDGSGLVASIFQPPVRDHDAAFPGGPSGLVYQESDLCPYKPFCDVIVNAIAYAPGGVAIPSLLVRLQVDPATSALYAGRQVERGPLIDKMLVVMGERRIEQRSCSAALLSRIKSLGRSRPSRWVVAHPEPFVACPVRYDYAYGGQNRLAPDSFAPEAQIARLRSKNCLNPAQMSRHPDASFDGLTVPIAHTVFEGNPMGCGFVTDWYLRESGACTITAPRIEYPDQPCFQSRLPVDQSERAQMHSAGFGVVGRTWVPRRQFLGTILEKDKWEEDEFPVLPAEFDHRYWNHAAQDQQCRHLHGDELITLTNLSPPGAPLTVPKSKQEVVKRFELPGHAFYLKLRDTYGRVAVKQCLLDTVYIDPELSVVDLVWRSAISVEGEVENIVVSLAAAGSERSELERRLLRQRSVAA